MNEINGRIRRGWLALVPALVALAAAFVFALMKRNHALALATAPLLIVSFMYGFIAHLWPNLRYRRFLLDMEEGLSRDVHGTIVNVADQAQLQDGAMVLPVRVRLVSQGVGASNGASALSERIQQLEADEDNREERIVYLNAGKKALLPPPGTVVTLRCFGRHIRSVEAEGM